MAYTIKTTKAFDKDMERCIRRGYPMDNLREVMKLLERNGSLPAMYRPSNSCSSRHGELVRSQQTRTRFYSAQPFTAS